MFQLYSVAKNGGFEDSPEYSEFIEDVGLQEAVDEGAIRKRIVTAMEQGELCDEDQEPLADYEELVYSTQERVLQE